MSLNFEPSEDTIVDEMLHFFHASRKLAKQRASKNPNSQWYRAKCANGSKLPLNAQSPQRVASVVNSRRVK